MPESIGQRLRRARILRGLTVRQVTEATRIRMQFVEALEADNYAVMTSAAQARGFLRNYAEFLELDLQAAIEELQQAPTQEEEAIRGPLDRVEPPISGEGRPVKPLPAPEAASGWARLRQALQGKRGVAADREPGAMPVGPDAAAAPDRSLPVPLPAPSRAAPLLTSPDAASPALTPEAGRTQASEQDRAALLKSPAEVSAPDLTTDAPADVVDAVTCPMSRLTRLQMPPAGWVNGSMSSLAPLPLSSAVVRRTTAARQALSCLRLPLLPSRPRSPRPLLRKTQVPY
jgi:transcriptional regulator with XRE-family HTH domain